jgi:valyl-tRNA synthetase
MPFVTEEIWQNLTGSLPAAESGSPDSIMVASYPTAAQPRSAPDAEAELEVVMQAIRAVRNVRAQLRIPAGQRLEAVIESNGMDTVVEQEKAVIGALARLDPVRVANNGDAEPASGVSLVVNPLVVRLPLTGVVDLSAESDRLGKELEEISRNEERVRQLLGNSNFVTRARPEVVENERNRLNGLSEQRGRIEGIISQLGG